VGSAVAKEMKKKPFEKKTEVAAGRGETMDC
jgi:hypothetical protein